MARLQCARPTTLTVTARWYIYLYYIVALPSSNTVFGTFAGHCAGQAPRYLTPVTPTNTVLIWSVTQQTDPTYLMPVTPTDIVLTWSVTQRAYLTYRMPVTPTDIVLTWSVTQRTDPTYLMPVTPTDTVLTWSRYASGSILPPQ